MSIHENSGLVWHYSELDQAVTLALTLREYGNSGLRDNDVRPGQRLNKSQAFYALTEKLQRVPEGLSESKGPAERKVWNVSSLLIDAGLDGIPGFSFGGGRNYQHELIDAVAIALGKPVKDFLTMVNAGRQRRKETTIRYADLVESVDTMLENERRGVRTSEAA